MNSVEPQRSTIFSLCFLPLFPMASKYAFASFASRAILDNVDLSQL